MWKSEYEYINNNYTPAITIKDNNDDNNNNNNNDNNNKDSDSEFNITDDELDELLDDEFEEKEIDDILNKMVSVKEYGEINTNKKTQCSVCKVHFHEWDLLSNQVDLEHILHPDSDSKREKYMNYNDKKNISYYVDIMYY